jgi:nucleoside-diphosphate-sugar epimerase
MRELAGKRVLVTGATGFIGSHLTRRLVVQGAEVVVFMRASSDPCLLADVLDRVAVHEVDICDEDGVSAAMAQICPDVVFHLAAIGMSEPFVSPPVAVRVNVQGTLHLLEAARQCGVRRFVHSGTAYEYGDAASDDATNKEVLDPVNTYAASKAAARAFVRLYSRVYGLSTVNLRLFAVYGPGQPPKTLISSAVCAALEGRDFPMTPGEQMRDFVFVGDVVESYLRAAVKAGIEGVSIDLGTGRACKIREVVTKLFEMVGSRGKPLVGALAYRPSETMKQVADTRAACELLGWQATTLLEDGLHQTIDWYRQGYDEAALQLPIAVRFPHSPALHALRQDIFRRPSTVNR